MKLHSYLLLVNYPYTLVCTKLSFNYIGGSSDAFLFFIITCSPCGAVTPGKLTFLVV